MRKLLLRVLFGSALALSVSLKHQAMNDRQLVEQPFDIRRAVIELTSDHGWTEQTPLVSLRPSLMRVMYFVVPTCSRAAIVFPIGLNVEEVSLFSRLIEPDYHRRFLYIEHTAPALNRIALHAEWIKHLALSPAGLTRYLPVRIAVMVAEPPGCHASELIDWRLIWERGRTPEPDARGATSALDPQSWGPRS